MFTEIFNYKNCFDWPLPVSIVHPDFKTDHFVSSEETKEIKKTCEEDLNMDIATVIFFLGYGTILFLQISTAVKTNYSFFFACNSKNVMSRTPI